MAGSSNFASAPNLTPIAIEYKNEEYIADIVSPAVKVPRKTDTYYKRGVSDFFDIYSTELGESDPVGESNSRYTKPTYTCRFFAHQEPLPRVARQEALADGLDIEPAIIQRVTNVVLLKREVAVKAILNASGSYGSNTSSPSTKWNANGGNPIADIASARDALVGLDGTAKLVVWFTLEAWQSFRVNPLVLAAMQPTKQIGMSDLESAAALLGVDRCVVARARYSSAGEGGDSPTLSRIWDSDNCGVVAVPRSETPSKFDLSFSLSFRLPVDGEMMSVQSYLDPARGPYGCDILRVAMSEAPAEITAPLAGYLLTNVNS